MDRQQSSEGFQGGSEGEMKIEEIKLRQKQMSVAASQPITADEGLCLWLSEIALQLAEHNQLARLCMSAQIGKTN